MNNNPENPDEHATTPLGSMTPEATRQRLNEVIDSIEDIADKRQDHLLLMTTHALRQVYALYPGAEALRFRGTPEQQAQVAIHNTILTVVNGYLEAHGQERHTVKTSHPGETDSQRTRFSIRRKPSAQPTTQNDDEPTLG